MAKNAIAIVGIHTGIGKTVVSAVITELLGADYWKPIQAGIEERDMFTVKRLISNDESRVHPEAVLLKMPASPHTAAAAEGIEIDYTKFEWPDTNKLLVVETAGGVLSPVSHTKTVADMVKDFNLSVVLVSQNYLGSINHTLTAIEALKSRQINIVGIVINGEPNESSEKFITQYSGDKIIMRIPLIDMSDQQSFMNAVGQAKVYKEVLRKVLLVNI
jgi:dethiobiotin synthetase